MTEEEALPERLRLPEREIATLCEGLDEIRAAPGDVADLKTAFTALRIFAGCHRTEFMKEFPEILLPEILQKVTGEE